MAKIDKNGQWHGKLGDYVYYVVNGKQLKRRVAAPRRGPKTEGMKRNALFSTEFGKAVAAGKWLRTALEPECTRLQYRDLYQRVTALMVKLKTCHESSEGSRTCTGGLATANGKMILQNFTFHPAKVRYPKLLRAVREGSKMAVQIKPYRRSGLLLTELQINLATGAFRRHEYNLPASGTENPLVIKKNYRSKKGYTELLFISGPDFLQGIVVESAEKADQKQDINGAV